MYHLRNLRRGCFSLTVLFFLALITTGVAEGVTYPPPLKNFPSYSRILTSGQKIIGEQISVKGARNEHFLYIFTLANADINNLNIQLNRPGNPSWLNYKVYQWRPIPENTPDNCFPDGLVPLEPGLVYQENPVHLAISLEITNNHPSGQFNYSLVIQSGSAILEQPLVVKVWSYSLPIDLPITFLANCRGELDWFGRYGVNSSNLHTTVYPAYLSTLRDYKINGIGAGFSPINANAIAAGTSISSFSDYTEMLNLIMSKYKFRHFRIPILTGRYAATEIGTDGSLFESAAPYYYQTWQKYLSERGWGNNAMVKVWDEPTAGMVPRVEGAYGIIKGSVPEFQTESAGWTVYPSLAGVIDNWAVYLTEYDSQQTSVAEAASLGQKSWLYANNLQRINHPPSYQRIIGWYAHKYKSSGYLLWSINWWGVDPWTTIPGTIDYYRSGTLIYPHPTTGMPLPTTRLEALRRGFEDYLQLTMMDKAVEQGKIALDNPALVEIKNDLATLIAEPAIGLKANWGSFDAIRIKIAQLLVSINSPVANAGSYQTVPLGGTVILNGTGSYDPAGGPLTYAWSVYSAPAGSAAVVNNPTASKPSFTPDKLGFYRLKLLVTDSLGLEKPAYVAVKALAP